MANSKVVFSLLSLAAALVFSLSLAIGSVSVFDANWHDLADSHSLAHALIFDLRLPRALTAFACGGLLALAGALMQVLLRNPLADPFIMGVSGGAAIGALTSMLLGLTTLLVDAAAGVGALMATILVFRLAHGEGGWTTARLLLTGVVVAAGASAIISLLLSLSDDSRLRNMLFWLMGDVSLSTRGDVLLVVLIVAVALCEPFARQLNVLARGETQARILGAPVDALRTGIFICGSIFTALTVTAAGTIGFVGLVTPHLARLMLGSDHRRVLPAAALLGGTLVSIADLVARTLFAPRQLPVGALTALAGVPLFLFLMRRVRS
ncbi:MAG TPA: iron ABC transporter permease [Steroidobacteraceae bacterium]|nr:iron ABC transporter permease [Steroidobacteraceae bacterium]